MFTRVLYRVVNPSNHEEWVPSEVVLGYCKWSKTNCRMECANSVFDFFFFFGSSLQNKPKQFRMSPLKCVLVVDKR